MANEVTIRPGDEDEARELLRKHGLPEGSTFGQASDQEGTAWKVFIAVRPDRTLLEESTGDVPAGIFEQMRAVVLQAHDAPDGLLQAKVEALRAEQAGPSPDETGSGR